VRLHFYIDNDDDAERCKESIGTKMQIAIGGTDPLTGRAKSYRGVVLAVETPPVAEACERWRITIDTQ
jgi:hypothetical protein